MNPDTVRRPGMQKARTKSVRAFAGLWGYSAVFAGLSVFFEAFRGSTTS